MVIELITTYAIIVYHH